ARFLPCRPCDREELFACYWPTLATRAAGTNESPGAPGTTPGTTPREASDPRGASAGGSAASRGDALGTGNPPLSGPLGAPRAHAPSPPSGSPPQSSAQGENQLRATVEAIDTFARCHQLPVRHAAMTKVRKQVPALAALVDFWWQGVHQDLEPFLLSPRWRQWVYECLLPM